MIATFGCPRPVNEPAILDRQDAIKLISTVRAPHRPDDSLAIARGKQVADQTTLGLPIEGAGRVGQHEHSWLLQDPARDSQLNALLLAAVRAETWHWRVASPFIALPPNRNLSIECPEPFVLHASFDGWTQTFDRPSVPEPFGMHAVRLDAAALWPTGRIDFAIDYPQDAHRKRVDYAITSGNDPN